MPHVFGHFVTEPRLASGLPKGAPVSKGSVPLHLCNSEKSNNQSPRTRSGQPLLNHRGRGGHRWEPVAATAPKLIRYLTSPAELARQALHSEQAGRYCHNVPHNMPHNSESYLVLPTKCTSRRRRNPGLWVLGLRVIGPCSLGLGVPVPWILESLSSTPMPESVKIIPYQ